MERDGGSVLSTPGFRASDRATSYTFPWSWPFASSQIGGVIVRRLSQAMRGRPGLQAAPVGYSTVDGDDGPGDVLSSRAMPTILDDFAGFLQEHRRCGKLEAAVEDGRVGMTCDGCGAELIRLLDEQQ